LTGHALSVELYAKQSTVSLKTRIGRCEAVADDEQARECNSSVYCYWFPAVIITTKLLGTAYERLNCNYCVKSGRVCMVYPYFGNVVITKK